MTQPSRSATQDTDPDGAPSDAEGEVIPLAGHRLLQRHLDGDRHAFAQLMQAHASPIYGYLARCGVGPAERDDLFQDIFCKVHRAASTHPPRGALEPWLFAIAVNTVRSHFRKVKTRSIVALDERPDAVAATDSPEHAAQARQTAAWIEAEITRLPLPQREVLLLCGLRQLDMKAAAEALDIPINTVKTRLRRARMALAEAAQRRAVRAAREEGR